MPLNMLLMLPQNVNGYQRENKDLGICDFFGYVIKRPIIVLFATLKNKMLFHNSRCIRRLMLEHKTCPRQGKIERAVILGVKFEISI